MTNLPLKYIHGIDVSHPDTTTLQRFAAAACEADYHLNEALKCIKASQAFLVSADVAQDFRARRIDGDYVHRTLDGLMDVGREFKAGFSELMFADSSIAPSLLDDARQGHFQAPDRAAVAGGRPTPAATDVTGAARVRETLASEDGKSWDVV